MLADRSQVLKCFLLIAVYLISNLALRENIEELDKSLTKIKNIDILK